MILHSGQMMIEEWNEKVIPALLSGKIKERKDIQTGFLTIYKLFDSYLEEEGKIFSTVCWVPPTGKAYIEIKPYKRECSVCGCYSTNSEIKINNNRCYNCNTKL